MNTVRRKVNNGGRLFVFAVLMAAAMMGVLQKHASAVDWETHTFGFVPCSNNNATDVQTGVNQLFVDVVDIGGGNVLFWLRNTGPNASSITDVYFEDGIPSISNIQNHGFVDRDDDFLGTTDDGEYNPNTGVDFSEGASPPQLPAGQECLGIQFGEQFNADSDSGRPGVQQNGVNPSETLGIVIALLSGVSYSDLIGGMEICDLQVGLHVQGFSGGGSESFVSACDPGTLVSLASFELVPDNAGVKLQWVTGAEVNNAGFNIYRAASPAGPFEHINDQLIAALGNGTGASYEYLDTGGRISDFYRLEDVDADGTKTFHLPRRSEVGEPRLFVPVIIGK